MVDVGIEIHLVRACWGEELADFFKHIRQDEDNCYFHPHPFTPEEATKRASYQGRDLYYLLVQDRRILGYGMLRGWDQGYDIPSLGIYLLSEARGKGLGRMFMQFLHMAVRVKGASKIRLKVYANNHTALQLYKSLGYVFRDKEGQQFIGYLNV